MQNQNKQVVGQLRPRGVAAWLLLTFIVFFLIFLAGAVALLRQGFTGDGAEVPTRAEVAVLPITPVIAANPTIAIIPSTGLPGTEVTVTGEGWQPADRLIVCLDDMGDTAEPPIFAITQTDKNGRFRAVFTFPTDVAWRSLPVIPVVVESESNQSSASIPFTVLTAPPTAVPATSTKVVEPILATATSTPTPQPPIPTNTPRPATAVPPTPNPNPPTATPLPTATVTPIPAVWRGEYFANSTLSGSPGLIRTEPAINFNWGSSAPAAGIPGDLFSVRWVGSFHFTAGTYRFFVHVDDGVRLWVGNLLLINEWHDADGATYYSDLVLSSGYHPIRLEYYENTGDAQVQLWWSQPGDYPEWRGEYWTNRYLDGTSLITRNDQEVNFNWGTNAPAAGLPIDRFSARWTRSLSFSEGNYRFHIRVDDGARLYVDGSLLIDEWRDGGVRERMASRWLGAGSHFLQVDYYDNTANAVIALWWEKEPTDYPDWRGEYWSNNSLSGSPTLVRNDAKVEFDWGFNAPDLGLPVDNFSARWRRNINFGSSGLFRFYAQSDDGIRILVDGERILNQWHDSSGNQIYTADVTLGGNHTVVIEYYDHLHTAHVKVWFERLEPTSTPTAPPPTITPMPTSSPIPTNTPSPTPTPTNVPTPTPTNTPVPTPTNTPVPTKQPTPDPTIRLNELLPLAGPTDWNGDGTADEMDEWIELYNSGKQTINLSGWRVSIASSDEQAFQFPEETVIRPNHYLVLYRSQTDLNLPESGGEMYLSNNNGQLVDMVIYPTLPADASFSRDHFGRWHSDWPPSPGKFNSPSGAGWQHEAMLNPKNPILKTPPSWKASSLWVALLFTLVSPIATVRCQQ